MEDCLSEDNKYRCGSDPELTPSYDLSRHGQRFLMLKGEQMQATTQINIVQN